MLGETETVSCFFYSLTFHTFCNPTQTQSLITSNLSIAIMALSSLKFNKKPPMDPELRALLSGVSFPQLDHVTPEVVKMMRSATATPPSYLEDLKTKGISHTEVRILSADGINHEIILSILQRESKATKPRPCIYWMHGGGFHWGDRLHTTEYAVDLILECDVVAVSVEYRLTPEYSFSTSLEDCYTGLRWVNDHVEELGIDAKYLMIGGTSAGGALAASLALLCRERNGPAVCAQMLVCPALDNRFETVSSHQFLEISDFMPRTIMDEVCEATLKGVTEGSSAINMMAGRMEDHSGLPMTYIDVGSAEVLRDDSVAYASKLWASGVPTELHVWAGAFHGFDLFLPQAAISQMGRKAKVEWAKRVFGC
jgi:acetyl esterase/lipase